MRTIGILLILIVVAGFVLAIPGVQTALAKKAVSILNEEYDLDISIKTATLSLPSTIYLTGVYAPDHRSDTLIYIDEVLFEFQGFQNNKLSAGSVELSSGKIRMRKYEEDTLYNFAIWLTHFDDDTPVQSEVPFQFGIDDIAILDFEYSKNPLGCDSCTWLDFYDAEILAHDFLLVDSYVKGDLDQMKFRDDRRFDLQYFYGHAEYQEGYMLLENFEFKTDESNVAGTARLDYDEISDFLDFLNKVRLKGEFEKGIVSSDEFISYIPEFPDFSKFDLRGIFSGTVHDLTANKVRADVGNSQFFGDIRLKDCTDPEKLYIDTYVGRFVTNGADFDRYAGQFLEDEVPEEVLRLTHVDLSGHFSGTTNDFTTEGSFATNFGEARVNIDFKNLRNLEIAEYKGEVDFYNFDFGSLLQMEDLGRVTAVGVVDGRSLNPRTATAELDIESSVVHWRGYDYRDISLLGTVADRKFNGDFSVHDRYIDLDFTGALDFSSDTASLDFVAVVDSTDLHTLGLINDTISTFGAKVRADFAIYKTEWWQGRIEMDSVSYRRSNESYLYNEIFLSSSNAGKITRNAIESDFMNGYIEGEYKLLDVYQPLLFAFASINKHYPYAPADTVLVDCNFELHLKETDLLTRLLIPGVRFARGTRVWGTMNSNNLAVDVNFQSPGIDLWGTFFDTTQARVRGVGGFYSMSSNIKSIFDDVSFETDNLKLNASLFKDSTVIAVQSLLKDSVDSDIHFRGYALQPEKDIFSIHWGLAEFNVGFDTLRLQPNNRLDIERNRFTFDNYEFVGNSGELYLNGVLSPEPYEILRARLVNLDLSILNYLLREPNTYLQGQADGMIVINDLFNHPSIGGTLSVDSLMLNHNHLGDLALMIDWDVSNNVQKLDGGITLGTRQTFDISGRVAQDSAQPLLVNLNLSRFRLAAFNPYLLGVMDNLRGTVQGSIRIAGTLAQPTLSGDLQLPNAAFSVPFLGTDYNFEGAPTIHLSSNQIVLDRVKLRDTREGTVGHASGVINHRNLSDLNFNLDIEADKMLGMDLREGENKYFFGKAYASGKVRIVGPSDQMNLRIDVEAERGTSLRLPLTSPTEVGESNFITFIDPTAAKDSTAFGFRQQVATDDLGGLSITVNANMRPEAEVRLVMDETVGGEIIGQGSGLIKINLSPEGDLSILGNYIVSEGNYNFNLQNIVTRPFVIESGSSLRWSGDPYDAQIELDAVYNTKAALWGMVSEVNNYGGQRYNVRLIMHLTGELMNPNITFDIEVPDAPAAWQEEIRNRLNDQDKLTENAFSLLAGYGFRDPNGSIVEDVEAQGINQLAGLMSGWANQELGDIVDFNASYQSFDSNPQSLQSGSEVELGFSRGFIDDRVRFNTNVDIPVPNSNVSTQQDVTGDFELEYRITEDGRFRAKAFYRSNQNNQTLVQLSPYSQGVGVQYSADFNTWNDLVEKIFGYRPEEPQVQQEDEPEAASQEQSPEDQDAESSEE